MADAATTKRGINPLLAAANLTTVEDGKRDMVLPTTPNNEQAQTWPDMSLSALFLDASRSATTQLLAEGNRKTGVFSLSDNSWHHIDWDPEVGLIELWPYSSGTDGIELATEAAVAANAGCEVGNGVHRALVVSDSPVGRMYVRRTDAGNGGNGSTTVKVNFICHGSRKMLGATNRVAGVAHA